MSKKKNIFRILLFVLLMNFFGFLNLNLACIAASTDKPSIDGVLNNVGTEAKYRSLNNDDFNKGANAAMVGRFIGIFLGVVGIIFTILLIYAGYLWFTAQGDAAALTKSKDIMMRAVIGLVIVLSAYVIAYFVTLSVTSIGYLK